MKLDFRKMVITALFATLNIIGSYIALALQLPIYLDTVGTMLAAIVFGPLYGALCGLIANVASGILFDASSLFFLPSAILIGFLAGIVNQKGFLEGKKYFLGTFLVAFLPSIVSSIIAAFAFGGITPSGSSLIAQWLYARGMNLVLAVFLTQFVTDYVDKFVTIGLAKIIGKRIPKSIVD